MSIKRASSSTGSTERRAESSPEPEEESEADLPAEVKLQPCESARCAVGVRKRPCPVSIKEHLDNFHRKMAAAPLRHESCLRQLPYTYLAQYLYMLEPFDYRETLIDKAIGTYCTTPMEGFSPRSVLRQREDRILQD